MQQVDAADQVAIDEFVATFNSGDVEAILASLTPDAVVEHDILSGGPVVRSEFEDLVEDWLAYTAMLNTEIVLSRCEQLAAVPPPAARPSQRCTRAITGDGPEGSISGRLSCSED